MEQHNGVAEHIPVQQQDQHPGLENEMHPKPVYDDFKPGLGRLNKKVAIITGGDSGIGRAVAVQFAKEGAEVVIVYLNEHADAKETAKAMERYGKKPLLLSLDVSQENNCEEIIRKTIRHFGAPDIIINNAAVQYEQHSVEEISAEQLEHTFRTNIFSQFYLVKFALPHLRPGSTIINTASVTAFKGNPVLIDYSSTKGAIIGYTRSLSQSLVKKGIRVNAVAPGPVWTPLIPSSFDEKKVAEFGRNTPMERPAQPIEIAPCYVFLASEESRFITGQPCIRMAAQW